MTKFNPMRYLPQQASWQKGDTVVIFGEVFSRGYVNGLIEEAEKHGLNIIYGTVGRRLDDGTLRPLNSDELAIQPKNLINVPLEAGFDMEPAGNELPAPVDQLEGLKLSEWQSAKLDWALIEKSRARGRESFRARVKTYMTQLDSILPKTGNILFVHTMAGGVPRAKIVMPAMNRVFKGFGDRYASSEEFWQTDMGQFCAASFMDVTANTLEDLIEFSSSIRESRRQNGSRVSYVAYGYHGTDVLINGDYQWQSYSPYLQGFAKIHLEEIAELAMQKGVSVSVFNAPEILTNSSSIFLGVEVSLYPLLGALAKYSKTHPQIQALVKSGLQKLREGNSVESLLKMTDEYFKSATIQTWSQYPLWPQHNGREQMQMMRHASSQLIELHKDQKDLLTALLSEVVFRACGKIMFHEAWQIQAPVWWLGHDIIALQTAQ